MINFVAGIITGALIVMAAVTIYGLVQMAGTYEKNIESWFDKND